MSRVIKFRAIAVVNDKYNGIKVGDSIPLTNTPLGLTAVVFHVSELTMRGLGGETYEYGVVMRDAP